jgi:hypothetical protein
MQVTCDHNYVPIHIYNYKLFIEIEYDQIEYDQIEYDQIEYKQVKYLIVDSFY